jgi:hypothetical protein
MWVYGSKETTVEKSPPMLRCMQFSATLQMLDSFFFPNAAFQQISLCYLN